MKGKRSRSLNRREKILSRFRLLFRSIKKFDDDHGFLLSSGIAFDLLLCLIPLLLLLLAFVGTYLYTEKEVLGGLRRYLENLLPSRDPRIMRNILTLVQDRKIVGVLGVGGLIWASTWVFGSLRTALNIVFHVDKNRGFMKGKVIDLLMLFVTGLLLLMSMLLTSAVTLVQSQLIPSFIALGPIFRWALKYVIPFFFTLSMFSLIYKILPDAKIHLSTVLKAAFFTGFLWEGAKQLFGWYVLHLGRFSVVYGSLSTLAIFFLWIYYSSAILLLGGEVAFFLEKERAV